MSHFQADGQVDLIKSPSVIFAYKIFQKTSLIQLKIWFLTYVFNIVLVKLAIMLLWLWLKPCQNYARKEQFDIFLWSQCCMLLINSLVTHILLTIFWLKLRIKIMPAARRPGTGISASIHCSLVTQPPMGPMGPETS